MFNLKESLSKLTFQRLQSLILLNKLNHLHISGTLRSYKKIGNLLNLEIQIGNEICKEFVLLDTVGSIKEGDKISFNLKDIRITLVDDKNYIQIFNAIVSKANNKILDDIEGLKEFNFKIFKFATTYNDIIFSDNKEQYLFTIILKVKQVMNIEKDDIYEFYDMLGEKIPVDYLKIKDKIEGQNIYIFNSFGFLKNENDTEQLVPLSFSSINLINKDNILYNKNITINETKITSFVGKVNKINLENNEIEIIVELNEKKI